MNELIIINERPIGGFLYHYAHFIQDCLFPEVVRGKPFQAKTVFRKFDIHNHFGYFLEIYEKIRDTKVTYLEPEEFHKKQSTLKKSRRTRGFKWTLKNVPFAIQKFQFHVFQKIRLWSLPYTAYDVILIERGVKQLTKDFEDKTKTGSQRREMKNINHIELFIKKLCKFKKLSYLRVQLEHIPFEQQVFLFHYAKLIVGIHGAGLSNLLFCKENTKVIEIRPIISDYFIEIGRSIPLNMKQVRNSRYHIKAAISDALRDERTY